MDEKQAERHYRIVVELVLCRHFPQIRGSGCEGIGESPGASYEAWYPGDKLDMAAAKPLAEAFVALHGDDLRAGATIYYPGTIRGTLSAMLILETAGIHPSKWELQMACQPGLWTYHPAPYCYKDGRGYTMAEFYADPDRREFCEYEGGRFFQLMGGIARDAAWRKNYNSPIIRAFAIAHGGPMDLGFTEAQFQKLRDPYLKRPVVYSKMIDIGKGEFKKATFKVVDVNRADNHPGDVPVDLIRVDD